ncbi:MAG TPA: N-acetylmuramoyl-L-alanine amidase [Clostridiaceae bacterium]|nr:N-acetylmuramoyl-L-alanine amidase [Clostridiaceae bacterium]
MKPKKAAQIVTWLLMVSVVLLVLSYFGVVDKPLALPPDPEKYAQTNLTTSNSEGSPSGTGVVNDSEELPKNDSEQTDSTGQSPDSEEVQPQPLIFTNNNPDLITTDGSELRIWPEESSLPEIGLPQVTGLTQLSPDKPLQGVVIILDPGHGGSDIGESWQGDSEDETLLEKTVNLQISSAIQEELIKQGAEVHMTRATDEKHSYFYIMAYTADMLLQRYANDVEQAGYDAQPLESLRLLMQDIIRINSGTVDSGGRGIFNSIGTPPNLKVIYDIEDYYKDTIFLSIHLESSENSEDKGVRVRYMSNEYIKDMNNSYAAGTDALTHAPNYNAYDSVQRERFASLLESNLTAQDAGMRSNLKAIIEDDLAVLRLNNVTSAQLTCGFLSNAADRTRLTSAEGQGAIARGVANALLQYYSAAP